MEFYSILLDFVWFCLIVIVFLHIYYILFDFIRFFDFAFAFKVLLHFVQFHLISFGFIRLYLVLFVFDSIGFYSIWFDFFWLHLILFGFVEVYLIHFLFDKFFDFALWVLLRFVEFHYVLLVFIWFPLIAFCCL